MTRLRKNSNRKPKIPFKVRPSRNASMHSVSKKWKTTGVPHPDTHAALLRRGIRLLEEVRPQLGTTRIVRTHGRAADKKRAFEVGSKNPHLEPLPGQPFDAHLLNWSPLFQRSRELYLDGGGKFAPSLVSSARSLSSTILLEQRIEYSPIEQEFAWAATHRAESLNSDYLLKLRTYTTSIYHEQNHRILWRILPRPPATPLLASSSTSPVASPQIKAALRRYLNFAESLVVILDMALADHLGPRLASLFYLTGAIYDPGTTVLESVKSAREYRNYLQAALHATYLNLELYSPKDISQLISALFPTLGKLAQRAITRSLNLDRAFVENTNPTWQKRNIRDVMKQLGNGAKPEEARSKKSEENTARNSNQNFSSSSLILSDNPMDNVQQYLIAERVMDLMGV